MKNRKVLIVGKKNHLGWVEHVRDGFFENSFEVKIFYTNHLSFGRNIKKSILKIKRDKKGEIALRVDQLNDLIGQFNPHIVFFVGAFFSDVELFALCKEKNIITAGWAGDLFGKDKKIYKNFIDYLFVADSGFVSTAKDLGFENVNLLQFGYNKAIHKNLNLPRRDSINFIGSYTKQRDDIFMLLKDYPIEIYGAKWNRLTNISDKWTVQNKKIDQNKVATIYNVTFATLNIAQKENIINMANMRVFESVACGTLLVNDNLKDIELCFEPGKEIVVYNDKENLKEIIHKIDKDKKLYEKIAKNGYNRLMKSDYSYKNRVKEIIQIIGVR